MVCLKEPNAKHILAASCGGNWTPDLEPISSSKIFIVDTGYVGITSPGVEYRDLVIQPANSHFPFVLRPSGNTYKLVGAARIAFSTTVRGRIYSVRPEDEASTDLRKFTLI
jgi:hypothetical protein